MSTLIDDILKLSRISTRRVERQSIALNAIAETVLEQLRKTSPERDVNVEIHHPMVAEADPKLIRLVFENLLGNAWKYTARNEASLIKSGSTIHGLDMDAVRVYFIQDNGVGFDMQYVEKLFQPFQRLHKETDFEGAGIGLVSVKRIIEMHKGQVWIKSVLNQGTVVYFILQASSKDVVSDLEPVFA
ncbi:diguanylate cyclase/phosphodiesterase (GGDEF & EAL domains) with PAS/PAC sensor(s) [hydrothermal vent metagenome]|uniref:histidine kinase n=1 Tax=hydrothermal vent metagenome TaxID=652676 RepID=A0A3B1AVM9_9ZZZZ